MRCSSDDAGGEAARRCPRLQRARHRQSGRGDLPRGAPARHRHAWSTARRRCRTGRVDIAAIGCDFYAFTGHKMLGPTGTGGLWARREHLAGDAALPRRRRDDPRSALRAAPSSTTRRTSSRPARPTSPASSAWAPRSTTCRRLGMAQHRGARAASCWRTPPRRWTRSTGLRIIGTRARQGGGDLVPGRGRARARPGHPARPGRHRGALRPPLRASADGLLRRAGDLPRLARLLQYFEDIDAPGGRRCAR